MTAKSSVVRSYIVTVAKDDGSDEQHTYVDAYDSADAITQVELEHRNSFPKRRVVKVRPGNQVEARPRLNRPYYRPPSVQA